MTELADALHGLTTRGRSLLASGAALILGAVLLGQRDLLRAGIFLVVLPLAAAVLVARTQYRLACVRHLDPPRVETGQSATVRLRLDNVSRLPSGVLLMEDALPYALGGRPRFVLDKVEPRGVRDVSYPVRADVRGRYRIGPLAVRLTDPFGLCELTRSFAGADDLIVTPPVTPLPSVRLGGDWAGGGDSTTRSVAASGSDDAATREYRNGDDLRKVHWRSTARAGQLMVRREEQPFQSRATLLLDGREVAHRGTGPASSYEYAVSAAASIAVSLARAGFVLRILDEGGDSLVPAAGALTEDLVLDTLATVQPTGAASLSPAIDRLRAGIDGVLITVVGAMSATDAEWLARLRIASGTCIALLLDTATWGPPSQRARFTETQPAEDTALLLRRAGWRVLQVAHGTTLSSVWPLAGGRPDARAPRVPGVPA